MNEHFNNINNILTIIKSHDSDIYSILTRMILDVHTWVYMFGHVLINFYLFDKILSIFFYLIIKKK